MFKRKHKVASQDYKIDDLPSNRNEIFFDLLRHRFNLILRNGLLLFLFLLPTLILLFSHYFIIDNIYQQYLNVEIMETDYLALLITYKNTKNLLLIPCLIIFSIGLSGVIRLTKMMVWYDHIFFTTDFGEGIKQNCKHLSVLTILLGLINYFNNYLKGIKIEGESIQWISLLLDALPLGFTLILFIPISLLVIAEISVYENSFLKRLKNSTLIYFKSFLKTGSLILVLLSMIALIFFINNIILKIIILIIVVIVYLPIALIIWQLYSYSLFDKYININFYPELVDKGIYRKKFERQN